MKKLLPVMLLIVILSVMALPTLADYDPAPFTPGDNACYEGGSMAGKCDLPTEDETEWAWNCGWYIARIENAALPAGSLPSWCTNVTVEALGMCFSGFISIGFDSRFAGPMDTLNNLLLYNSVNATCQTLLFQVTMVSGADSTEAAANCLTITDVPTSPAYLVSHGGWLCYIFPPS